MTISKSKPLRIAYCSNRYFPAPGGLEVFLRNSAQAMAQRHHVTVVAACQDDRSLRESLRSPPACSESTLTDNPRIVPIQLPLLARIASCLLSLETSILAIAPRKHYYFVRSAFMSYASRLIAPTVRPYVNDVDIIHSFGPWDLSYSIARLRPKSPHVVTGFLHAGFWADDLFSLRHFLACDHVIALTHAERNDYIRMGVPPSRVTVVPVPAPERYPGGSHVKRSPATSSAPTVLFLGVKRDYKGLDLLLSAAPIVWRRIPEARFVFAGARTDYSRTLFSRQAPDPRIVEYGHINEDEKQELLDSCSLLCLPSATEIMPNVVLEAWLASKPVITSLTPSLRELVGSAGLCVERVPETLASAILRVLVVPEFAKDLGERGRERCMRRHALAETTDRLESIYRRLLEQPQPEVRLQPT